MKFAEHLAAHITPEWRKQYIQYEVGPRRRLRLRPLPPCCSAGSGAGEWLGAGCVRAKPAPVPRVSSGQGGGGPGSAARAARVSSSAYRSLAVQRGCEAAPPPGGGAWRPAASRLFSRREDAVKATCLSVGGRGYGSCRPPKLGTSQRKSAGWPIN